MSANQRQRPAAAGDADDSPGLGPGLGPAPGRGRLPRLRHLFDGDDTNVYNDDVCNLCAGTPGPDLLRRCADIFEEATAHRMAHERKDAFLFQYGATAGPWDFREELSSFLTKRYDDPVNADDLILTCGATHGLQLILNSFIEPDGVILVEEVTYMIAIAVFREFTGMRVVPVPFSDTGVVASELERVAREEKSRRGDRSTGKPFWGVFYSIPVYHNPTGVCTSPEVGAEVVRLAQSLGFLVACDDVYNLLHYGPGSAPRRLHSLERSLAPADARRHVVSNGSFSKILAPGVRVGWLEAPADLAHQLRTSGILRSGGGVNSYVAGVICSALQLGLLDRHLDLLLTTLSGRMRALCDALEAALPAGCALHPARPQGGYFVWLRLPAWVDAQALHRYARDTRRVSAFPGAIFSTATPGAGADASRHCLRLAIAFHDEQRLAAAAADLCAAIDEFIRREGRDKSD